MKWDWPHVKKDTKLRLWVSNHEREVNSDLENEVSILSDANGKDGKEEDQKAMHFTIFNHVLIVL